MAHFENKGAGERAGSGLHRPEHSLELLLRNNLSYNNTVLGQSLNTIPTLPPLLPPLLLTRFASSIFTHHNLPGMIVIMLDSQSSTALRGSGSARTFSQNTSGSVSGFNSGSFECNSVL